MSVKNLFRYTLFVCLAGLSVLALDGCRLFKQSVVERTVMSEDENIVRKVFNAHPEVQFSETRFTGKAAENDTKISFMGTAKIEKDKQLHILLRSAFGIELARVYANRDSIWITSKMLGIRERIDWKVAAGKIGYPLDFNAIQGIFLQSLFTSTGNELPNLIDNLVVDANSPNLRLVSRQNLKNGENGLKYLNDFIINRDAYYIDDAKIKDVNGQWIADIKFEYQRDNEIKKIILTGIDAERNYAVEINVIKNELKDFIEINFNKF